jgi:hypothetical protein
VYDTVYVSVRSQKISSRSSKLRWASYNSCVWIKLWDEKRKEKSEVFFFCFCLLFTYTV